MNTNNSEHSNHSGSRSIVQLKNLSHRYGVDWAIRNIDFEIDKHEVLGLLGSNGAGKSTTMNILCGVINQTEGEVYINGINLRTHPEEAKKNIGFLPQKPPLYPDLTVEEYITHTAHLRLIPAKQVPAAVEKSMEKCGLTHMRQRMIGNLSGGYQQRVGIAQAIVHEPRLVIFDEPTTGLDPNNMAEVRKLIKEIAEDRAVILCTHILTEAQAVCDNIKMIEKGRLIFSDTIEAFNHYIEPDTLILSALNPPAIDDIAQIDGVHGVEQLDTQRFRIGFDPSKPVSETLIQHGVDNQWRIDELAVEKQSLDLIFAQLSREAELARGED